MGKKVTDNIFIAQKADGLYVNDTLFLPIIIDKITPHYHFTAYSSSRKGYEIKMTEVGSLIPDNPIILSYEKDDPKKLLHDLRFYGLKSGLSVNDTLKIWEAIANDKGLYHLHEKPLLSSDHCGCILFKDDLYYMTYGFAISKDGLIPEYHCIAPAAHLSYDEDLNEVDAFLEAFDLINLAPSEAMPILVTQILSLLQPIVIKERLRSIPGLFLSGPTSTGKTELAITLGSLFGDPNAKDLQNFLTLQNRHKTFKELSQAFSDTTFILDDARKPNAPSLSQSITNLIERVGRSAFQKNEVVLTPIITGEPKVLSSHLESLRNRFVEIYLDPSAEKMLDRKALIGKAKENILPYRTCLLYFIRFISDNFHRNRFYKEIHQAEADFRALYKDPLYRDNDNLLMHYLGFRIFLYYGLTINAITRDRYERYLHGYKDILRSMEQNYRLYSKEEQGKAFIRFLCSSIETGYLAIYVPEVQRCHYRDGDYRYHSTDCYGHFSIVDISHGFSGVYIRDRSALPSDISHKKALPVLALNADALLEVMCREDDRFEEANGYRILPRRETELKHLLADIGLLYVEDRNEKSPRGRDLYNYSCKYPHWIDQGIRYERVYCINMDSPYAQDLIACIDAATSMELPDGCIYCSNHFSGSLNFTEFEDLFSFSVTL